MGSSEAEEPGRLPFGSFLTAPFSASVPPRKPPGWNFTVTPSVAECTARSLVPSLTRSAARITSYTFAAAVIERELYVAVALQWDFACAVCHVSGGTLRVAHSLRGHRDLVTAVCFSADGTTLVTGSRDTTCLVWRLVPERSAGPIGSLPRHTLSGHDGAVTCLALCLQLDVVASGSVDGSVILHSPGEGTYERTLWHPGRLPVDLVAVTEQYGDVIFFSNTDRRLHSFTINGLPLHSISAPTGLNALLVTPDSRFLVTGGEYRTSADHSLVVRSLPSLEVVHSYTGPHCGVCSVALHPDTQLLVTGLEDGSVMFFGIHLPTP